MGRGTKSVDPLVAYFRIHPGGSMEGRFIAFMWGEAYTLFEIRIQFPIFLWPFCRWDFDTDGLLNGLYIFRVGWVFRIRDKKFFTKGTKIIVQHFRYAWSPWHKKCHYLSDELLEDAGLTNLYQHLARVKPRDIWDEYYNKNREVIARGKDERAFRIYDERNKQVSLR